MPSATFVYNGKLFCLEVYKAQSHFCDFFWMHSFSKKSRVPSDELSGSVRSVLFTPKAVTQMVFFSNNARIDLNRQCIQHLSHELTQKMKAVCTWAWDSWTHHAILTWGGIACLTEILIASSVSQSGTLSFKYRSCFLNPRGACPGATIRYASERTMIIMGRVFSETERWLFYF